MDRRLVHGSLRRKARQPALPSPSPKPCGSPVPRRGSPGNPFRGSQIANGRLKTKSPARWPGLFDEDLDTLIVALAPAGCKGVKMTACCGTLVLAAFTKHGIYMAADSRIVGRKSDDAQKIFQCGATALVGIAGLLGARRPEPGGARFDMMDAIKRLCLNYTGKQGAVSEYVPRTAWNELRKFWDAFIGPDFGSFAAGYPDR